MPTSPLFQPLKPDLSVTCAKTNEGAGVEHARKETIPTHSTNVNLCLELGLFTLDFGNFENISDLVFAFGKLHSRFQLYQRLWI